MTGPHGMRSARPQLDELYASGPGGIVSTSHPLATEAGVAALRAGGHAVDAYLAAAAVQAVVEPTMTTIGGRLNVFVYDAATRRSHTVAGPFGRPAAEEGDFDRGALRQGRTVVAPGWVCGAHAAWRRWGRRGWAELFEAAIGHATDGFVVDQLLSNQMFGYRRTIGLHPEGREVWFPGGYPLAVGDTLRQPALAGTLARIAADGPCHMYEGDFARRYVERAHANGGRITLRDMAAHRGAAVTAEVRAVPTASGHELHTGATLLGMALNLAHIGRLADRGRIAKRGESLYLALRIVEECWHAGLDAATASGPAVEKRLVELAAPEHAERLWPEVESGRPRPYNPVPSETNALVVVDTDGNVAHGSHSITSVPFGAGLMVDGVIVARPVSLYTHPIDLADTTGALVGGVLGAPPGVGTSVLVTRNGRPVFAAASPSISCFTNLFQNAVNVLEHGMDPLESVHQPLFGAPEEATLKPMVEATMGLDVLAEAEGRGARVTPVSPWEVEMGSCQAVHWDADGTPHGVADPRRRGRVAALPAPARR